MSLLRQDIRYALRAFSRNPGFTTAAVLSLAIAIGANTSIFSVANALLLRPLPYKDAGRLTILWNRSPGLDIAEDWFSTAQYFDIKTGHQGFENVAIAIGGNYNLTGDGEPERVGTIRVSSNLLPMLGARPAFGRLFAGAEDSPGAAATAVLSYGMWARRYGSDPRVIGKAITLNGQTYQVAGVTARDFSLPREVLPTLGGAGQADILLPLPLGPAAARDRDHEDYNVIAKLKSGVSIQQAQAEMDTITARLRRDFPHVYPPNGGLTFGVVPLLEQVVGEVRRPLLVILGSVAFVLLIACANVANLLLSRAVSVQKEIGVRAALGATRGRIVRQFLTESILLATGGGILGVLLSFWSVSWIRILGARSVPRLADIGVDGRVLLFALLLSLCSGILFGLAPALRAATMNVQDALKNSARGSAGASSVWGRGNNVRRLLVVTELGLSVVLLAGAGLLIRSFSHLQRIARGFRPEGVLTLGVSMIGRKYTASQVALDTYRQLWERLERLPGVTAAGGISALPLSQAFAWGPIVVEGRTPLPGENFINADQRTVGGRYFEAMKIPLLRGRPFDDHDTLSSPRVVIVDENMAQQLWPNADPIGRRIRTGGLKTDAPWRTVVGVAGKVKQYALDSDSRIAFYVPHAQGPTRGMTVVARSGSDPAALTAAIKNEIRDLDPDLPVYSARTMKSRVDESLARRRFSMLLLGLFAGIAIALAAIGVYGVIAFLVSQGTREIGIRIALGATQNSILGLVLRRGMTLAAAGVASGLVGAFALTRFMRSLLFGVEATDAATFIAVSLILGFIALAATYIPARRAARVDPMTSLQCD